MPANRFLLPAVAAVLLLPSAAMGFSASSVSGAMEDTAERESAAAESAAGTAQSNGAARGGDSAAEAEDPAPAPERAAAPAPASGSNGAQPAPSSRAKDSGKDRAEEDAASGSDLSEDELADSLRDAVIEYAEGEYEQLPDRASYDSQGRGARAPYQYGEGPLHASRKVLAPSRADPDHEVQACGSCLS